MASTDLPDLFQTGDHASRPAATAVAAGTLYACSDHSLIYQSDAATWTTWADLSGGAPGTTFVGRVLMAPVTGMSPEPANQVTPTASAAYMFEVKVPGPMLVGGLRVHMQGAASGTYQWGLFDFSSSLSAATKVAGGSGALNATGWVTIAATGAPVTIDAGVYALILLVPAANQGAIYRGWTASTSASSGLVKSQAAWSWDDTPDLVTGWGATGVNTYGMSLVGYLDGSTSWL